MYTCDLSRESSDEDEEHANIVQMDSTSYNV